MADKAVNYSIRKGIQISRSTVKWYEHNDMKDLERVLAQVVKDQARKPLTRRFLVTEGLFEDIGDVVDLPKIVCCALPKGTPTDRHLGRTERAIQVPADP